MLRTATVEVPPATRSTRTAVTSSRALTAEVTRDAHDPQVRPVTSKLAVTSPVDVGTDEARVPLAKASLAVVSWGAQQAQPEDDLSVRVRSEEEVPHMVISKQEWAIRVRGWDPVVVQAGSSRIR